MPFFLALAALLALTWWLTGPDKDEAFSYSATCMATTDGAVHTPAVAWELDLSEQEVDELRAACALWANNRRVYRIDRTNQQIISRMDGSPILLRWESCTIFDAQNWRCEYPDGSGSVGMVDGLLARPVQDQLKWNRITGHSVQQYRWQHWLTEAANFFGHPPVFGLLKPDQPDF